MDNGRDAARTVLCVDVGNSDTNLGLFVGGELEATWKVTTTVYNVYIYPQLSIKNH